MKRARAKLELVERLPEEPPPGEHADVPPLTDGERDFLRWLVRSAIERRRKKASEEP